MAVKKRSTRKPLRQIQSTILFRGVKYYFFNEFLTSSRAKQKAREAIGRGYKVRLIKLKDDILPFLPQSTLMYIHPKPTIGLYKSLKIG